MSAKKTDVTGEGAAAAGKRYAVLVRGAQSVEIMVGVRYMKFMPGEPQVLESDVVLHPDFLAQAHRFGVQEVQA
jgi:hypothetical protein